ncbi:MAG: sensor histidine kinase [Armatimonadota bacterium]
MTNDRDNTVITVVAGLDRAQLAHIRHELRTPINAILGYSEILLEDCAGLDQAAQVKADLQQIHAGGKGLLALINDLLDTARVEMALAQTSAESVSESVRAALCGPLTALIGQCETLVAGVERQGLGVFSPDIDKILTASRTLQGMVEELVHLSVIDDENPGPAPQSAETAPIQQPAARSSLPEESYLLIVDDNEINRDLLSRRLEAEGYRVAVACDGREALAMIALRPPELVLLDVMMPEMDGFQVLQALKSGPLRDLPVIMVSALDEVDSVARCIEMGAEDYLAKPFEPVLLRARVGASLEKKRLRDREAQLFAELQVNYKQLQELESLRDSLTHMIVHDLRTPLTSLLTGMMTVEGLGELNEDQREFLEISIGGGQTLLGMINDLLDISKMESGTLTLERKETRVDALLTAALSQVAPLAREKELLLVTDIADKLPPLHADGDKLLRTVVNLLGNALKFTPPGGVVTVSVRAEADGSAVRFAVADTGEGIPQESFARIFDKFGQVESRKAGRKMSTGLGLTFCKMVVDAHNGHIWVDSELGKGSVFTFTIPLQ